MMVWSSHSSEWWRPLCFGAHDLSFDLVRLSLESGLQFGFLRRLLQPMDFVDLRA